MNRSAPKAFNHFAGSRSFDTTPVEKLETLAAGYPYFPIAQFFWAKKLKDEQSDLFLPQAQKAVLYFQNPMLFDLRLNGEMTALTSAEEVASNPEAVEIETQAATEAIPASAAHTFAEGAQKKAEETVAAVDMSAPDPLIDQQESEEVVASEENGNAVAATVPINETPDATTTQPAVESTGEAISIEPENDEHEKMFRSIKAMLDATSEEADMPVDEMEIPIDPYHTIDYFASQGIKLDLDMNDKDRLTQNLKKFTQWLKHMKKLGPEDAKTEMDGVTTDSSVQEMADSSNSVKEVVTEAMAAVLEKQGKKAKAIELYRKLSFLNPDKSAYFAAQIEKIKGV